MPEAYNCGVANEDNEHHLLHCARINQLREDLFGTVTEVSGIDVANLDSETLCNLLLYGSSNMNMIDNRIIIEATIEVKLIGGAGVCLGGGMGFPCPVAWVACLYLSIRTR